MSINILPYNFFLISKCELLAVSSPKLKRPSTPSISPLKLIFFFSFFLCFTTKNIHKKKVPRTEVPKMVGSGSIWRNNSNL